MELYTVVKRQEYDSSYIEIYQPDIICDSLESARNFIEQEIRTLKDNFIKENISFIIKKYKLNESGFNFIESINYL